MVFRSILHGAKLFAMIACAACDVGYPVAGVGGDERPIAVHIEVVAAAPATPALAVPGVVEAGSSRLLAFRFAGRVARVYVAEGDRVAAGEAVAEFDQAMLERSVRAAAVAVERAEARLVATERRTGRRQQLFALASDARGVPATDTIEGEVQAAEIRFARVVLAGAEARRAAGVLRARADGIVDRRYLAEGDVAASGEPVVRIIELSSVVVRAAVPRALLPLVKAGGAAEVRSGAGRSPGTIRRVDTTVDAADGAVPFEVRAENAGFALRPGAVVEVGVEVPYDEAEFSIPLGSVQRGIEARPFTFVVVKIGGSERIARRPITLGGLRGDRASVVAGLAVGDRVVSFGQDLVTVGDPVTVVGEGP